ncbi:hypothetical protein A2U01_0056980 [Trifolium medium]|uniref:Uncharacterized protein n=1 Tax=Trifolium medium TaxID=97028 RepID=A0A392RHM9_9FABA|nr:hypothetical protein [Trifolium medium]
MNFEQRKKFEVCRRSLSDHQREIARADIKFQGSKRLVARVVAEREVARKSDAKQKVSGLVARVSERWRPYGFLTWLNSPQVQKMAHSTNKMTC